MFLLDSPARANRSASGSQRINSEGYSVSPLAVMSSAAPIASPASHSGMDPAMERLVSRKTAAVPVSVSSPFDASMVSVQAQTLVLSETRYISVFLARSDLYSQVWLLNTREFGDELRLPLGATATTTISFQLFCGWGILELPTINRKPRVQS